MATIDSSLFVRCTDRMDPISSSRYESYTSYLLSGLNRDHFGALATVWPGAFIRKRQYALLVVDSLPLGRQLLDPNPSNLIDSDDIPFIGTLVLIQAFAFIWLTYLFKPHDLS